MTARSLREVIYKTAHATGLFSLSARSKHRGSRLLILCYHGIALEDEAQWRGHLFISRAQFRRRLELLRNFGANVLRLGEAMQHLHRGTLPPRSVVITFDDGFADFPVHAVPLLKAFGYPATLYLSTHYCRHRRPVYNLMLDYLLWKSRRSSVELPGFEFPAPLPVRDYAERQVVVNGLARWAEARTLGTEDKDGMVRQVAGLLGLDYDRILGTRILQIMTPEEVAESARSDVAVELHTHRHRAPRDRDLFIREIRDNAKCIREFAGQEPAHFCYPSGDYDRSFFPWLQELGVHTATTCEPGLVTARTEPYLVPRILDDSIASDIDFQRWLSGFLM